METLEDLYLAGRNPEYDANPKNPGMDLEVLCAGI